MIPRQRQIAHRLEVIDRWGKLFTILTVLVGVVVGGICVYQNWVAASSYLAH
jgi:hypothetical protein